MNRLITILSFVIGFIVLGGIFQGCQKQRSFDPINLCSDCVDNMTPYWSKTIIDNEIVREEFFFNVSTFLDFTSQYGAGNNGHIFDFNSDGVVGVSDHLDVMSGYGVEYTGEISPCEVMIDFPNSHGWIGNYADSLFCIVHLSPQDENGDTFNACPLNSYWLEVVFPDSVVQIHYH